MTYATEDSLEDTDRVLFGHILLNFVYILIATTFVESCTSGIKQEALETKAALTKRIDNLESSQTITFTVRRLEISKSRVITESGGFLEVPDAVIWASLEESKSFFGLKRGNVLTHVWAK